MIKFYPIAGLAAALLLSTGVYAADIQVEDAWARATPPGRKSANVYFFITSKQDATLVSASSTAARAVGLRTMLHKNGTMKTIAVDSIELPANSRIDMTSEHSYHLTLIDLKAPLKAGDTVPLTLNVDMADKHSVKVEVIAEIKPPRK